MESFFLYLGNAVGNNALALCQVSVLYADGLEIIRSVHVSIAKAISVVSKSSQ